MNHTHAPGFIAESRPCVTCDSSHQPERFESRVKQHFRANSRAFLAFVLAGVLCFSGRVFGQSVISSSAPAEMSGIALSQPAETHSLTMHPPSFAPPFWAAAPFAALLLAIALLPLIKSTAHWWEHHKSKLIVALVLSGLTLAYYLLRGVGVSIEQHHFVPGISTAFAVLRHAVLDEYIPFMVLLFSLYTICGGIVLRGDLRATPAINAAFLGIGAISASLVGTTGASMLLIRPLLQTNRERTHVRHTVVFFIFLVSNVGGCLLPIGDPPLFLGYLRGVPFFWTLNLFKAWGFCTGLLLVVYLIWDTIAFKREPELNKLLDRELIEPISLGGKLNLVWLFGVVAAVANIRPGEPLLSMTSIRSPEYLREGIMLMFVAIAWLTTPQTNRDRNQFNFAAIVEVAVLFIGIFITMQLPIEILHVQGPRLGLTGPHQFFWASGALSSFLDNAPTYVVFFEAANSFTHTGGPGVLELLSGDFIRKDLLAAISLGSVFMGANTYIGNGPNFMVKSIAEQSDVRMPSFFGYMAYSICILIPTFLLVMWLFL